MSSATEATGATIEAVPDTFAVSVFDAPVSNTTKQRLAGWQELCRRLKKDVVVLPDCENATKDRHGQYFVRGKITGKRKDENLSDCCLLILDIDKPLPGGELPTVHDIHDALKDIIHVAYTSVTPGRSRIIVPVEPYEKEQTGTLTRQLYEHCRSVGLEFSYAGESEAKSQAWFYGQTLDRSTFVCLVNDDGLLFNPDPDLVLEDNHKADTDTSGAEQKTSKNRLADFIEQLKTGTIHQAAKVYAGWLSRTTNLSKRQIFNDISVLVDAHCSDPEKVARWHDGERASLEAWFDFNVEGQEPEPAPPGDWFWEKIKAGGVGRFLDYQPPVLDFVSANSLMAGTVGMLVGPGAVGKTTLATQMAAAVATGRDILPGLFTPTKPGKVLICAAEDGEAVLHHRFAALANALFTFDSEAQDLLRENLLIISVTGHDLRLIKAVNGSFEVTSFYEKVRSTLADITGLRVVFFDPQSRWYGAEENDNGAGTFFISCLEKIAQDTGAGIMSSHHVTKRAGYGNKGDFSLDEAMHQDAARGASGLTNAVRWQMNLFGLPEKEAKNRLGAKDIKPGQYLAAKVSKKNYGPPEQVYFLERGQGGVFSITAPAEQRMAEDLERIARSLILNAVTACEGRQMTKRTLIDGHLSEWKNTDQRITRPVMEQAVAACIVHMELFERIGKNPKGRIVTYLSRFREPGESTISKTDMFDTVN